MSVILTRDTWFEYQDSTQGKIKCRYEERGREQISKIRRFQLQERQHTAFQVKIRLFWSYIEIFITIHYDYMNIFDIFTQCESSHKCVGSLCVDKKFHRQIVSVSVFHRKNNRFLARVIFLRIMQKWQNGKSGRIGRLHLREAIEASLHFASWYRIQILGDRKPNPKFSHQQYRCGTQCLWLDQAAFFAAKCQGM